MAVKGRRLLTRGHSYPHYEKADRLVNGKCSRANAAGGHSAEAPVNFPRRATHQTTPTARCWYGQLPISFPMIDQVVAEDAVSLHRPNGRNERPRSGRRIPDALTLKQSVNPTSRLCRLLI